MARQAISFVLFSLVVAVASAGRPGRVLSQSTVSAQDLTNAFSKINNYAKVPDISASIASTPDYANKVSKAQGPASEVVSVANRLTAPTPSPDTPDIRAALQAYGYQQGKSALSPIGQKVYDAYTGLTQALLS